MPFKVFNGTRYSGWDDRLREKNIFEVNSALQESGVWMIDTMNIFQIKFIGWVGCHYTLKLIWMKILCWTCEWDTNTIIEIYTRRDWKLCRDGGILPFGMLWYIRDIYYCVGYSSMGILTNLEGVHTTRQAYDVKYIWDYVGVCAPLWNIFFTDIVLHKIKILISRWAGDT